MNKSVFPDSASNNQYARYFYYLGRIKSTQLEYTEAQKYLNEVRFSAQPRHLKSTPAVPTFRVKLLRMTGLLWVPGTAQGSTDRCDRVSSHGDKAALDCATSEG